MVASNWPARTRSPAFTASWMMRPPACADTVLCLTGSTTPSNSKPTATDWAAAFTTATSGGAASARRERGDGMPHRQCDQQAVQESRVT